MNLSCLFYTHNICVVCASRGKNAKACLDQATKGGQSNETGGRGGSVKSATDTRSTCCCVTRPLTY